ncbi:MAG: 30S ribosomal protein S18 [Planctomycetota bacterium]|jgi:small subunit ribosomal protein S18|nr:30S ribosomal protein S18 [Planctomycetota bacterium]
MEERTDQKKYRKFRQDNRCRFCREKIGDIDYKNIALLQKLCTAHGKLMSRKRSGNCARHQRVVKAQIKLARFMAIMPYVG